MSIYSFLSSSFGSLGTRGVAAQPDGKSGVGKLEIHLFTVLILESNIFLFRILIFWGNKISCTLCVHHEKSGPYLIFTVLLKYDQLNSYTASDRILDHLISIISDFFRLESVIWIFWHKHLVLSGKSNWILNFDAHITLIMFDYSDDHREICDDYWIVLLWFLIKLHPSCLESKIGECQQLQAQLQILFLIPHSIPNDDEDNDTVNVEWCQCWWWSWW